MDTQGSASATYFVRFADYFARDVAERAAKSIADGSEVEIRIGESWGNPVEVVTFGRKGRRNFVKAGAAEDPQIIFELTPVSAEAILEDPSTDLGEIGIRIVKMIVQPSVGARVRVNIRAGFLTLLRRGYMGVVTAGGAAFASSLAAHGLSGMGAIQAALKKAKRPNGDA